MVIFSHTGSPQVKISQKVLGGGGYFFDSHCIYRDHTSKALQILEFIKKRISVCVGNSVISKPEADRRHRYLHIHFQVALLAFPLVQT